MRGIFALWVLGYHLRSLHPVPMPDPFGILLRGYLGVDFFFLLSGFVLAGAYGGRDYNLRNVCRFAVMRVGRMYPLHLAVIIVCLIAAWLLGNPHSWRRIIVEGSLVQNWPGVTVPLRSINGPSWTISVELLANLLLAAAGWFPLRVNRFFAVVIGLVAYGSIMAIAVQHDGVLDLSMANSATPFYRCFSEFVIGVLLFRWRNTGSYLSGTALSILSAITIGAIISNISDRIVVSLLAILILGIAANNGNLLRFLESRPIYFLGKISFSVYLVHLPVLYAVSFLVMRTSLSVTPVLVLYVVGTVLITIGVSSLTYKYIEEWGRITSKRWAASIGKSRSSVVV